MVCWEVVLSKGQQWDWFGDPFWRVQTLVGLMVVCFISLILRETHIRNPVVNFRPLLNRNFAVACVIIFCAYGVLYGTSTTLPGLLQSLFNYDATNSGLVMSPSGIFAVMMLPIVAYLMAHGTDARRLIITGLIVMGLGNYWMSHMNLEIAPTQVIWPRVVLIMGLSMTFAPLNVAAYMYLPKNLRGAAVGLFSLLRNEGGSVGTSMSQTLQERREQFHLLRLGEVINPLNPNVQSMSAGLRQYFYHFNGNAPLSQEMALQAIANLRQQQASSLAFFDVFWALSVISFGLVFLVFFMKRSVAEQGAHVHAD